MWNHIRHGSNCFNWKLSSKARSKNQSWWLSMSFHFTPPPNTYKNVVAEKSTLYYIKFFKSTNHPPPQSDIKNTWQLAGDVLSCFQCWVPRSIMKHDDKKIFCFCILLWFLTLTLIENPKTLILKIRKIYT